MKCLIGLIYLSLLITPQVMAQPFASWTDSTLKLNNGIVERTIVLPTGNGPFITKSYKPVEGTFNYFADTSTDFQFEVNGKMYSGKGLWRLKCVARLTDAREGDGASVTLVSEDKKIQISILFLLYPHSPAIRKALVIKNISSETINLESVDVEKFDITKYYASTFSWICHDYGRRRSLGPYDGNMQDALIIVHNSDLQQGIVIGNEAPGVLKHASVFWEELSIASGLTHKDSRFPFRKYIKSGDSFTTPEVFTMVYNNHKDPEEMLNTAVPDFVHKYIGIRLSELKEKPTFVYDTWVPFGKDINEDLIRQVAKSAAAAGMKEFVIDDGWQDSYGDWGIDKTKFPDGLKPVFDYIKSLGMKLAYG
jgi:alpha-galactosidase